MSNPNKARGTRWETSVERYLKDEGFKVYRQPLRGKADCGDIHIGDSVVVECKSQQRHSFAEWLDEAETEASNAGLDVGIVWAHRRGFASPADGYVVMSGRTLAYLLRERGA